MRSSWALPGEKLTFDWVTDFDSWDRCITRGMPSSMFPYRYNNGLRIMQAPGMVVLDLEMIHDVAHRLHGRPAAAAVDRSSSTWASRAATGKATRWSS